MPDLAEPPPTLNPELAKLFQVKGAEPAPEPTENIGIDSPTPFPEPSDKTKRPEPAPEPAPTPPAPGPEPAPEPPKPAAKANPALRLAPDFALDIKPPAPAPAMSDPATGMPEAAPDYIKTPKQKEDYQKWRRSQMEMHREIETLRSKVAAPPAAAPEDTGTKVLLETVTRERDELLAKVERVDLMSSPKFQKEYMEPHNRVLAKAQGIIKDAGGDPNALQHALALNGTARAERLDDLRGAITSETMRGQFDLLIRDIDDKRATISEKLQNARVAADEFKKQEIIEKHQNGEKSVAEMSALLGAARKALEEEAGWSILKKSDDPDFAWWNEDIDKADASAKHLLLNASPDETALAAVLAPQAPRLFKLLQNTQAVVRELQAEIADLKGSSPKISQERAAAAVQADGAEPADILGRLAAGAYRK